VSPAALRRLLDACGVPTAGLPDEATLQRLDAILDLRRRWQRTHKLTGPQINADPWGHDVVDALALLHVMDPDLPLIDVGAGAGAPGLLVAALRPAHPVHLVEPITKRVAFLRTAAHPAQLTALRITRARWPLVPDAPSQVVSRAVVSPQAWPDLALSGGPQVTAVLCMLGSEQSQREALAALECVNALDYTTRAGATRRVERWVRRSPPS
jgi:16S rRNA (guanine527-N7)-methyltransferase